MPVDASVVKPLVESLLAHYSREEILAVGAKYRVDPWPTRYRNRDTGKWYKPHHEGERRFVESDVPRYTLAKGGEGGGKSAAGIIKCLERIRRGMSGIMVCVAADTLVDGIPIAERSEPAPVNTLFGPALASSSHREGRADLFRVVTESGDQVVITANHRFLTPVGWRPLRDLRVGSLVAVDGSEHGRFWREISPGSLGGYLMAPRPLRSCQYSSIKWSRLSSITFQRYGDFYGLTVPFVGHYSAQGVFHHNSPDLPHFKRSLWPEFQRWCPWNQVHEKFRYMGEFTWQPYAPFILPFTNGAQLYCGGMDEPAAWEGPNVNFAFADEMRRKAKPDVLKVLDGRVRISGPSGEPPQIFFTTTPRKHWLYHYFGPLRCRCQACGERNEIAVQEGETLHCKKCGSSNLALEDERVAFKLDSYVTTLLTADNEDNLEPGFAAKRRQTLNESEARVLLEAAWEDYQTGQPFLPSMVWWDRCRADLPPLDAAEPLVLAVDAASGRDMSASDCFGIVGVTRHPSRRADAVAVRFVQAWQAAPGDIIDFQGTETDPGPELVLRRLHRDFNVICTVYDPTQLSDMSGRLRKERVGWLEKFGQNGRIGADTDLLHLIQERRVAHDGNPLLRQHIANADRKVDSDGRLRIVKREDALKIDLAICLSMAAHICLYLNLS